MKTKKTVKSSTEKTKVIKPKTKIVKDEAYLELDGVVSWVEVKGNKITRSPIDGEAVLKVLLSVIESGLNRLDKK